MKKIKKKERKFTVYPGAMMKVRCYDSKRMKVIMVFMRVNIYFLRANQDDEGGRLKKMVSDKTITLGLIKKHDYAQTRKREREKK